MVYVRIEIWPGGNRSSARLLQELTIINDGSGDAERGNYDVVVGHSTTYKGDGFADPTRPTPAELWRRGRVRGFPRRRGSPASLVLAALAAALNGSSR